LTHRVLDSCSAFAHKPTPHRNDGFVFLAFGLLTVKKIEL
jgi:hypothetical protein